MKDPYVRLAELTVHTRIKDGRTLTLHRAKNLLTLPEDMLTQKAGVFVTLYAGGALRGCIGTIEPEKNSIAEEILQNAVWSATEDPRFPPVRKEELAAIQTSVDVLLPKESCTFGDLDPERYGVIVTSGFRRGLLLPRLDGVESAQKQVAIALQKAGIHPGEPYRIERFEVVRHA